MQWKVGSLLSLVSAFNTLLRVECSAYLALQVSCHLRRSSDDGGGGVVLRASVNPSAARAVTVLEHTRNYVVVSKPPSVVCHHSDWTGSKARNETPMLQRVRDALHHQCDAATDASTAATATTDTTDSASTKLRVNLIHRLDRGCSGCLLFAIAPPHSPPQGVGGLEGNGDGNDGLESVTARLIRAMQNPRSRKTYLALVRGEGALSGQNLSDRGWFLVDRPIKDETGKLRDASTWFRFVAGQDDAGGTRPRASVVLCRPTTGRWHQVRRHLNGLSHPILGDSSHGNSRINRMWRTRYGMLPERTCLHLSRLQLKVTETESQPPTSAGSGSPSMANTPLMDIDVSCPLAFDMKHMLELHLPEVLEKALPLLQDEGIVL